MVEQTLIKHMAERLNKTMVKQIVAFVYCFRALFPCVASVFCICTQEYQQNTCAWDHGKR